MNYELFQAINGLAGQHPWLDSLMVFITQKALIIYALILLIMWFVGRDNYKRTVVYAAITGGLGLLINFILGLIYYEPRPFVTHTVHLLIQHAQDASFPSDHTTGAFSLAFAVLLRRHRKIGVGMLAFAVLTGFSRVYVGHHYPFDVLGSVIVSIFMSIVVHKFERQLEPLSRTIIHIYNRIPLVPKTVQSQTRNINN